MKKNFTLLIAFLISLSFSAFSQQSLSVNNPEWGWWGENAPALIEEATFILRPEGAYFETEMILTVAADQNAYTWYADTELEIVLDFNLPKGSIVHDSWLWMLDDETIVKADILDISSAEDTYEEIVGRRTDPSILYKNGESYQIRVYPLLGNGTRKFKITYLSPAIWDDNSVSTWLPTNILKTSNIPIETIKVITFPNTTWLNPRLEGLPFNQFIDVTDSNSTPLTITEFSGYEVNKPIKFTVDSPLSNDHFFVTKSNTGGDSFYQLAYMPPVIETTESAKKILVLIADQPENSTLELSDILSFLGQQLSRNLTSNDYFNIITDSGGTAQLLSQDWISGGTSNLSDLVSQAQALPQNPNRLLELIEDGVDFSVNHGGNVDILFLTNSSIYWNSNDIDLQSLFQQMEENNIHIHIVDYQTDNLDQVNWGPPFELRPTNYSFYQDLSTRSAGNFYSNSDGSIHLWESLDLLLKKLKATAYNFELHSSLANGFTFDRFHQNYGGQSFDANSPILQIGKFVGDFPLKIDFSAYVDGTFVADSKIIQEDEIIQADTLLREIWMGHYLPSMDAFANVQEIVDLSIQERVLTPFTAFLAVDLENGAEPCWKCWEYEFPTVGTDDKDESKGNTIKITTSPNPFVDYCKIEFKITDDFDTEAVSIQIFDTFGKLVLSLEASNLFSQTESEWEWNGNDASGNPLPPGTYFLTIQTKTDVHTLKITKI